jgi:hypothetical protein
VAFSISGVEMATTNPFDIAAPDPTKTLATNAATASITPTVATNTTAANGAFAPATTSTYDSTSSAANSYGASTYDPTKWNIDPNQTVQGQINSVIAADSPLMQQAKTGALQQMNQRGLINSSMAVGAGQDAVMKNALPIAQQDASMYGRSGEFNATAANQAGQFNTSAQNQAQQFNTAAANQTALQNQQAANQASQFNAGALTDTSKFNATSGLQNSQFNAAQQNSQNEANAQRQQQSNLASAETQNKLVIQQLDNSFKATMASADNQTKIQLQQIDATTRTSLAATEAQFKQLMQTSASASDLYIQAIKNINDLVMNPDLDAGAISSGTNTQLKNLQSGMAVLDALNTNVAGLKDLITF